MATTPAKRPAEIFGYPIANRSEEAQAVREGYQRPFTTQRCAKKSRLIDYPFGVCSVESQGNCTP
jgi:hypothetical protein